MASSHVVAVVGGTGPQGRGLAYRFALAGHRVILGSRDSARSSTTADEINAKLAELSAEPRAAVSGATNVDAVAAADIALLAVPWDGHQELVEALADGLRGKIVISCVNPLGFDSTGPYGLSMTESAAEETQRLVPEARVVGAFHHVAAQSLWTSPEPLTHEDVLVCADEIDAKAVVLQLAGSVTGKLGLDAGALRMARVLEPLTAVLISINKNYKTRSGIAIAGVPASGTQSKGAKG